MTTLRDLLTKEPADDGKPLFVTITALSKAIVAEKSSEYNNERSVSTLLGFIFCGSRSCPKPLREMILHVIQKRLAKSSQQIQEEWNKLISNSIDSLSLDTKKALQARSERNEDHFDKLIECLEAADKVFIITSSTAEQERGIERADKLNKILLKRLGIFPKSDTSPKVDYWFLLPSFKTGEHFWEKLYEKALSVLKNNPKETIWIKNRLKFLEENGFLRVFIVPPFICSSHSVFFNPDYSRNCTGFSYIYYSNNFMDAACWDPLSITHWKENVFDRFQWRDSRTKEGFTNEAETMEFMRKNPNYFAGYRCHVPFC